MHVIERQCRRTHKVHIQSHENYLFHLNNDRNYVKKYLSKIIFPSLNFMFFFRTSNYFYKLHFDFAISGKP